MSRYPDPSVRHWPDWVGVVGRLIPGLVFLYAGIIKIGNVEGFAFDIRAYQLVGWDVSQILSYVLPVVEIAVGVLLIVGLLTRWAALVTMVLLIAFMGGIAWVWSQGISIDCGCFGQGGEVAPENTQYPQKLAENLAMAALCCWLVVRPRSLFSLDQALFGSPIRFSEESHNDIAEMAETEE
jgi:methylamine utilisation protein mauE